MSAAGGPAGAMFWIFAADGIPDYDGYTVYVQSGQSQSTLALIKAHGAALLAGVGVGVFADEASAVNSCVSTAAVHEPDPAHQQYYNELYPVYHDSALALIDINHRLARLGSPARKES